MIFDLATTHNPAVNGRDVSVSPVQTRHMLTEMSVSPSPAGGGNIHTSQIHPHPSDCQCSDCLALRARHRGEAAVVTAARPIIIKEILALLGDDIPDPVAHTRYLDTLSFSDLCARRDQLLLEKQERLKEEELRMQPELPVRPLRQKRFFYGRQS